MSLLAFIPFSSRIFGRYLIATLEPTGAVAGWSKLTGASQIFFTLGIALAFSNVNKKQEYPVFIDLRELIAHACGRVL